MKTVADLKSGDYIAFGFNFHGGTPNEIWVTNITTINDGNFVVHFMYGHHSLSEIIKPEGVLAIGNPDSKTKIKGWGGRFDIIQPDHFLMKDSIELKD